MSGLTEEEVIAKLASIHAQYHIKYGTFLEELPEQKIAIRNLTGKEKVLEIGGNVGRNAIVISHVVGDANFVTIESNPQIAAQLKENRDSNNKHFAIEAAALSSRRMIQLDGLSQPGEELIEGWQWVNTITWPELQRKYNISFDTLVLDCEGAFYYILRDTPEILNNINMIFLENDFRIGGQKAYVDEQFIANGFRRIYTEPHPESPTQLDFFEVWKK